jgi:hypothetical protein
MKILNKKQGTTWEITDEAHIKRLLADPNYEEAKPEKKSKEPDKTASG